ncbi:MAG: hypothetical protein J0H15_03190 [Xanthomonadales bacterium]|nr:hypothetical protein [Xanthomonadales bacterium]
MLPLRIDRLAGGLLAALFCLAAEAGQAASGDEERVAAQMQAELAGAPTAPAGAAVTRGLQDRPAAESPVMVEVVAPEPPPPHAADGSGAVPSAAAEGVPFADLARLVGHRVTLVTTGERVHRGVVAAASAREVTLEVRRAGGTATYTLRREQVARIDPR